MRTDGSRRGTRAGTDVGRGRRSALLLGLLVVAAAGAAVPAPAEAQRTETLVGSRTSNGGFGGPVMKVGELFGEPVLFLGGRGAWVAGRTCALGGGG